MAKIVQEFHCNDCVGYFRVKLNMALNHSVDVVCPNCGHHHPRIIKDGVIFEGSRNGGEEICPPKSAYSKTSIFEKAHHERGGKIVPSEAEISPEIKHRWFERFGLRV